MIYDVSMPIREGMPVYTNNPPFKRLITHELAQGHKVNQSKVEMGCHCGTHVDAPYHFEPDGYRVPDMPLESLVGKARLLHFPSQDAIDLGDLAPLDWTGVSRVLFRTRNSDDWKAGKPFDPKFTYLSGPGAVFLAEKKLRLVGIDSLGIEQYGNKQAPAHHALLRNGISLIEGLYLADVPPGDYILFCGPLRMEGSEGAPARAFLLTPDALT
jgi:arylformamidase